MTDDVQVDALKALVASISAGGGTNWEDAWFRALMKQDGTPQNVKPNTIVFFTDGVPSWSRVDQRGDGGILPANPVKYPAASPYNWPAATGNGSILHQESFDRTEYLIQNEAAGIRIVGVAVGPNIGE